MAALHNPHTNIGPTAIAHPNGHHAHPPPIPAHHHLDASPNATAPTPNHLPEDTKSLDYPDLPAFPDNIPTAPLLRLSLARLLAGDKAETQALSKACRELGFFYLDLRGAGGGLEENPTETSQDGHVDGDALLQDASTLFTLGGQLFALPEAEKQKYDFAAKGSYFGYKGLGAGVIDATGTKDRNEFYNVSKNDILQTPGAQRWPAPAVLQSETAQTRLTEFMRRSHAIVALILARLEAELQLPERALRSLHRLNVESGDHVRWIRAPPSPPKTAAQQTLGEHTDFGSVTLLFNRLGGLQVLPPAGALPGQPSPPQWCYVKPLRGHCVVNLGDAMVKFSAGLLRSNLHRVVAPPGDQATETRMSLVYFARPEDQVSLKALKGSEVIEAARREANGGVVEEEEEISAKDWILRRALGRRTGGDWKKAGGTEGVRV